MTSFVIARRNDEAIQPICGFVRLARTLCVVLFACLLALNTYAQEPRAKPERDLELWTSLAVETRPFAVKGRPEYGFRKNFRTAFETGYRSNENLGNGKSFYTNLSLRYRAFKWLRVGMDHRYNIRDKYSSNSYRLDGSLQFQGEWKRFEGSFRTIFQHEFIPVYRLRDVWRNRFAIGWRTKKFPIDPYVSCETFTGIWYKGNYFAGVRYDLGAQWELGKEKNSTVELILRHDREIGVRAPLYRTIISVAYEYYWKR